MDTEWNKFKMTIPKHIHKRTEMKSFMYGMGSRLSKRLDEMKTENNSALTSNQLVLIKKDLVERALKNEGVDLRHKKTTVQYNPNSFTAGESAAEKVRFARGIQNGPAGGTKMISCG